MLKIEYTEDSQEALLFVDEPSQAWNSIRRICEEQTEEVKNHSATSLSLPWWAFLSCRKRIGTVQVTTSLQIVLGSHAKELLLTSKKKESNYEASKTTSPLPTDKVRELLYAANFTRHLTDEQTRNVSKLAALPAGASFSVPGAGKTTEALAYYFLKRTQEARLIIVAPKNAFAAWEEQLALCIPENDFQVTRLQGGQETIGVLLHEEPQIAIVSYQQFLTVSDQIASYMSSHQTFMVLDESHRMKRGQEGAIGSSILNLSHIPEFKLILSGTPLPNSVNDLLPQFAFLYPEVHVDETNVKERIQPIYVRTIKRELGLKPPKILVVPVSLAPAQRRLYDLLRYEEARQADPVLGVRDRNRLRSIGKSAIRLLQLSSNPALLAGISFPHPTLLRDVLAEGDSPKMLYACRRARDLARKGQKTIIWSGFVQNVELLATRLADLGADYIHGGVEAGSDQDSETREAKIKRFHENLDARVLVANPAAASESISLHTVCHHAIYLDRNYNAGQYLQSQDRIHRLGLPPNIETTIEILAAPDTIDESIEYRLKTKIDTMASVLNDPSLRIEEIYVDEDDTGFDAADANDFLSHLRGD